jgi:putative FmdB family regulatory protein
MTEVYIVPMYRYCCPVCGNEFSVMHSMNDKPVVKCDKCGNTAKKSISSVGISFKGSGYYITDSKTTSKHST